MTNNNRSWTIADDAELDHMLNQGLSYKAIGRVLGRSDKAVMARRMRQGILPPKKRVSAAAVASATAERMRIVAWLKNHDGFGAPWFGQAIENGEHLK